MQLRVFAAFCTRLQLMKEVLFLKSVDPGILPQSSCFTFNPSGFAKESLLYLTWCGHYFCTDQYYMERDTFPHLLLMFIRRGRMYVRYRNNNYVAEKGDVLLMDCREPHYYGAENNTEFLYIHFDGVSSHEIVQYLMQQNGGPIFRTDANVQIGKLLYDEKERYENSYERSLFDTSFWIHNLLHELSKTATAPRTELSPIDEAIHYIRQHIGETITLDDLAKLTNFSPYYLSHVFKKQTGYSPLEYVINTRLEKAQIMLTHTQKSINEIAYQVGYNSSSSFINVFTKKIGYTPKTYRKMQQREIQQERKK